MKNPGGLFYVLSTPENFDSLWLKLIWALMECVICSSSRQYLCTDKVTFIDVDVLYQYFSVIFLPSSVREALVGLRCAARVGFYSLASKVTD